MLDLTQDGFENKSIRSSIAGTDFDLVLSYSDVGVNPEASVQSTFDFTESRVRANKGTRYDIAFAV